MPAMPDCKDLQTLLTKPPAYAKLKEEAESRVSRWVWGTVVAFPLRPFYVEIWRLGAQQVLDKAPKKRAGYSAFGFDERSRLVIVRRYNEFEGQFDEDFISYGDGGAEQWSYGHSPGDKEKPRAVSAYDFDGPRLQRFRGCGEFSSTVEVYDWKGQKLVRMRSVARYARFKPAEVRKSVFDFDYDGGGVTIRSGGSVIYEKPAEPMAKTLKKVTEQLLERIPTLVARAKDKLDGPAFCLALTYDDGSYDGFVPPTLVLGQEKERRAWHGKKKTSPDTLWDPQQLALYDDDDLDWDDDDPLLVLGETVGHQLRTAGSSEPARKVLQAVAKKLNAYPWKSVIPVTADFVVYAIDLEGAHLEPNMKASVPAPRLAKLRAAGEL